MGPAFDLRGSPQKQTYPKIWLGFLHYTETDFWMITVLKVFIGPGDGFVTSPPLLMFANRLEPCIPCTVDTGGLSLAQRVGGVGFHC